MLDHEKDALRDDARRVLGDDMYDDLVSKMGEETVLNAWKGTSNDTAYSSGSGPSYDPVPDSSRDRGLYDGSVPGFSTDPVLEEIRRQEEARREAAEGCARVLGPLITWGGIAAAFIFGGPAIGLSIIGGLYLLGVIINAWQKALELGESPLVFVGATLIMLGMIGGLGYGIYRIAPFIWSSTVIWWQWLSGHFVG